ncbi:cysteine-rich receptor-like protein kinase 14 isoform X1 [Hibiscus syriacus]|uniref:cysteine-rich receptor-like protein kinase 14 isoform X1 n=1 Tax=Hibiscus syriacus TaxID=106335 RepID=UPI0019223918|nr:cysteine-rich receptor-like protein kinase 14 isoform X1 [Hibiscus syriacus]
MQCTPDLSDKDCDSCLRQSVAYYESCCHGKQGGYVQKPNCWFRWDLYPFYVPDTSTTAPKCYDDTGNFTTNSTYGKNRDSILDSLPLKVSANGGFFNPTIGQNSDKVYALGMCVGGNSSDLCYRCLSFTINNLIDSCPNQKEALSWGGDILCFVRYANRSFYGKLELEPVMESPDSSVITSNLTEFDMVWDSLMERLMTKASTRSSSLKYATEEAEFTVDQKIYALMQCTSDLSKWDCKACLMASVADYGRCCHGQQGGYIQRPNCIFRWDRYPFYVTNASSNTASLTPPTAPGSPSVVTKGEGSDEQKKSIWLPLGASLSAALGLALFSACAFFIWRRRNIQEDKEDSGEVQLLDMMVGSAPHDNLSEKFNLDDVGRSQEFPSMQLHILQAATNSFSDENKLGQGGFGPVYKGILADGKEIAVKRLSKTSSQGLLEFKNEVMLIARLQHRNLVRLLGCCLEKNEKLLVYEFMPNKSLDLFLFNSSLAAQLTWQKRLNIIRGTARGIMYLHEDSRLRIIHRDLKASNVLLDHEMNPKISDFGMAKIFGGDQNEANTNRVVGTYGYMAPEYAMEGHFSVKSDVFSFGVLLLEIITGKRNNGFHLSEHGESLLIFAWKLWSKGEAMELIEEHVLESSVPTEVLKCIQIGLLCVQADPVDRPTMTTVVAMLGNDTITLPLPAEPAFYVRRIVAEPIQPNSSDKICSVNEVTISNMSPR